MNTRKFASLLETTHNLLLIQDLDGVCMGLVNDPLTREIDVSYVTSTKEFEGSFFVLTNGEHTGCRGVNTIIEKAFGDPELVQSNGLYLPGLAAGGVQWQDCFGNITHPGVSEAELSFLATVPERIGDCIRQFIYAHPEIISDNMIEHHIKVSVLDNIASPSANLNQMYQVLGEHLNLYPELQQRMLDLMEDLLCEAAIQELENSFFLHLAPNLGRDLNGKEIIRWAHETDSGTTDFQFMLRGAVKEAGVVALLNRYYEQRTGKFPLGKTFNARQAPKQNAELLSLVRDNFDPKLMPIMVGVGDTVTSSVSQENGEVVVQRGGSDRNFLQLIQDIGKEFDHGNVVAYIDSSGGELKNRKPVKVDRSNPEQPIAIEGPGDPQDQNEPLRLDIIFAGGHTEYISVFQAAAQNRARANIA